MKIEQISEHIWSLKSWMLIPCTVWVVAEEDGLTLVDAGMPFMAKGILKFLEQMKATGTLQRILLTHGHGDHVGSVKAILERYTVPVYAHATEIPYMDGDQIYPRRKKPEHNIPRKITTPLGEGENSLQRVGSLLPVFTPGHSPGHVVYYHEQDGVLLSGDLFTSKNGRLRRPMRMFTADMAQAVQSAACLRDLKPKRVEICHGKPVFQPSEQVEEYLKAHS
ncbi:MBL fold metallo-hydrolase [Tumebacillus sp. ITR2]|uniref:MBL fold metallo-hydrolase n=1 Tax=Tumebacillus amylolyticus TaxID=2801339 RepID=A0ABS1JD86_9BACL|nr:MBL fold metallo-hydrolase [Tumebacillus amylolyticus]MBL0388241.1 MBL fold metallo-hydrolase [Tumebacillus amylolyticus]